MKKLSIYFKKETLKNLHRLQACYTLSGKDPARAPKISEILDAMISFELNILRNIPDEKSNLRVFFSDKRFEMKDIKDFALSDKLDSLTIEEEIGVDDNSEIRFESETSSEIDRFLYVVADNIERELEEVINMTSYKGSPASIVRDIAEKFFFEDGQRTAGYLHLFSKTYVGFLYSLDLRASFFFAMAYDGLITIDEFVKQTNNGITISVVRQIVLEEAKITEFRKYLRVNRLKETLLSVKDLGNYVFLINRKSYWKNYFKFYDRGRNFNYIQAYIGYHMLLGFKNFYKYYLGIPTPVEMFINFKRVSLTKPGNLLNEIEKALIFSKKLNSAI
jgi:hypothetical protein